MSETYKIHSDSIVTVKIESPDGRYYDAIAKYAGEIRRQFNALEGEDRLNPDGNPIGGQTWELEVEVPGSREEIVSSYLKLTLKGGVRKERTKIPRINNSNIFATEVTFVTE